MVSKVLCFAFLACILVQFVPATARPSGNMSEELAINRDGDGDGDSGTDHTADDNTSHVAGPTSTTSTTVAPSLLGLDTTNVVQALNRTTAAATKMYSDAKESVKKPWELTKIAASDVWAAGTQGVKTGWKLGTTLFRFGKGVFTRFGTGTALKDAATETLAENGASITENFEKDMKARNSIHTLGIEAAQSVVSLAKTPFTLVKSVAKPAN